MHIYMYTCIHIHFLHYYILWLKNNVNNTNLDVYMHTCMSCFLKTLFLSATTVSEYFRILKCYSSPYLLSYILQKEQIVFTLLTYVWGVPEVLWFVQSREEETQISWWPTASSKKWRLLYLLSEIRRMCHANCVELCQGRFMLGIWKKFFSEIVVEHWNRLPRKWSWHQRLTAFEKHFDNALRRMV